MTADTPTPGRVTNPPISPDEWLYVSLVVTCGVVAVALVVADAFMRGGSPSWWWAVLEAALLTCYRRLW